MATKLLTSSRPSSTVPLSLNVFETHCANLPDLSYGAKGPATFDILKIMQRSQPSTKACSKANLERP